MLHARTTRHKLMNMERAQASIEFLVLVAFFMIFLIPLALTMLDLSSEKGDESSLAQAYQLGRRLADNADEIYLQGDGATTVENMLFPSKVSDFQLVNYVDADGQSRGEITITVETRNGPSDIVFLTLGPLDYGTSPLINYLGAGTKPVRITNTGGQVVIEYGG